MHPPAHAAKPDTGLVFKDPILSKDLGILKDSITAEVVAYSQEPPRT